ncbi:MAG TPA: VanZ family protein [Phycicoccus sp.]|nr:VanZ family protein [Phycicoccus sp.]
MSQRVWRGVAWAACAAYLAAALTLVLWPNGESVRHLLLRVYLFGLYDLGVPPSVTPDWYAAVANVLLLLPGTWALMVLLGRRRWPWIVAVGLLGGVGAESAQAVFSAHRVFEWGDIAANVSGALLGVALGAVTDRWLQRRACLRRETDTA